MLAVGTGHDDWDGTPGPGRDSGTGTGHRDWDGSPGLGWDTGTGTGHWDRDRDRTPGPDTGTNDGTKSGIENLSHLKNFVRNDFGRNLDWDGR